ncbi:hypothetical protein [Nitritalea halalkaliphila]|uniref:hypothetical protein n=1 Tax=Nitritalea halalkaliphila TaxID=590849 RepID=UPI0002FA484B|nr:hypothetical protein [Nitritalea halalkaliphila]
MFKSSGEELKIRRDALLRRGFSFEAITGFQFRDEAGRDAMFQVAEFRYRLRASQVVILLENSGEASAA